MVRDGAEAGVDFGAVPPGFVALGGDAGDLAAEAAVFFLKGGGIRRGH